MQRTAKKAAAGAAAAVFGEWALPSRLRLFPADAERGQTRSAPRVCRLLVVEDEGLVALEIETFLAACRS